MVCKQYHEERTLPLIHTVGKDILQSGDDYFLLGSAEMEDFPKLLKLAQKDCYYSLVEKAIKSLEYHYLVNTSFDWYFIGDDDTFVNVNNLNKLIDSLEQYIQQPTEFYIVGSTRHVNGNEAASCGAVAIKGGAGILMNRATFLELRNTSSSFHHNVKYWAVQDGTFDLLINLHNSNILDQPKKHITYMHCNEFFGDRNAVEEAEIYRSITLHNRFYGIYLPNRHRRTMYELHAMSKNELTPFDFGYHHFFSPPQDYLDKVTNKVY